jgi:hypothetical protein
MDSSLQGTAIREDRIGYLCTSPYQDLAGNRKREEEGKGAKSDREMGRTSAAKIDEADGNGRKGVRWRRGIGERSLKLEIN